MVSYPVSRTVSVATGGYAVYCAVRPRHVANAVGAEGAVAETYDRLARTYFARDIGIGALGAFGPAATVPLSIGLRLLGDVGDSWALSIDQEPKVRQKVLKITLGWAALNAAALLIDRKR